MNEFYQQLQRHLTFIRKSCDEYDKGNTDEALRIAVSLRVIFHDTSNSTSILTHIERKKLISLISTFSLNNLNLPNSENVIWHTAIPLMLTSQGVKSPLETWETRAILSAEEWWNEVIWKEANQDYSRKDIVLSAANQDGGAHVDSSPNHKTLKFREGPSGTVKINGITIQNPFVNHHFPLLRQFAYEVLNSKELTSL